MTSCLGAFGLAGLTLFAVACAPEARSPPAKADKSATEADAAPAKPDAEPPEKKKKTKTVQNDFFSAGHLARALKGSLGKFEVCGETHATELGTLVHVSWKIDGTGELTHFRVDDPHTGTPLGACVEEVFRTVEFGKTKTGGKGGVGIPVTPKK